MSRFELFKNRHEAQEEDRKAKAINFIENHLSSTEVYNLKANKNIKVVLTRNHKEGVYETLLFSYIDPIAENNLKPGDYIKHKNKYFIVMQEYDHPLQNDYLKYNLIECNSVLRVDDIEQPAAYFGSLRAYSANKAVAQEGFSLIKEDNKPVIITQANGGLDIGTRFILAAEAFRIVSIDRITQTGVYAMSVTQDQIMLSEDDLVDEIAITPQEPEFIADIEKYQRGSIETVETTDGFIQITPYADIIRRTSTEVKFQVPYDVEELNVKIKKSDGSFETITREVE